MKAFKIILIIVLCLVCAAGGFFAIREYRQNQEIKNNLAQAEALYAAGDYESAKLWYAQNGLSDKMELCDRKQLEKEYDAAAALFDSGDYENAKAAFTALAGYSDSEDYITRCDFMLAKAVADSGELYSAISMLDRLGSYPEALELAAELRHELYLQAQQLAYECRMDEAIELLGKLGDDADAQRLMRRCKDWKEKSAAGYEKPILDPYRVTYTGETGKVYTTNIGPVYVPDECSSETRCLIFYPGGYDEALPNGYFWQFFQSTNANAICVFSLTNGYFGMDIRAESAYQILEQIAIERGVFLHDMVVSGVSMGGYTAMHSIVDYYVNHDLSVKTALIFDAGNDWLEIDHILSAEDCDIAAEVGTEFFLFEGPREGMNKTAIRTMVIHGCNVSVVKCENWAHDSMVPDAMILGIFDYYLGAKKEVVSLNYTYYPLDKDSLYPYED